jgi:lipopolysaccharide/colanic/teichoic acid biosynthesis glycosyltransferase
MRVWPVILDSQPSYLRGRGRSASLLLAPLGTEVVLQYFVAALAEVTDCPPVVVASEVADPRYADWVHALCPSAQVVNTPQALAEAFAGHELSDARLFVDPRCLPTGGLGFADLLRHHVAEPRVAHHLVAFERAIAGTRESVSFDGSGQIRGIQRYYEQSTWSFIAGTTASLVPCACGVASGGDLPRSLDELRHLLISRGVPSRDVQIDGGSLDLSEEGGILAANEALALEASSARLVEESVSTVYIGSGHAVDPTARLMGPIVVHPDASIDANATILGPAVIGAGARIGAGALVAHATIGADSVVPPNVVVRDHAWFKNSGDNVFDLAARPPMPYNERLARLTLNVEHQRSVTRFRNRSVERNSESGVGEARVGLALKRSLDIAVAAIGLTLSLPVFLVIAVAIWLESKGPTFFGDKREGLGGRVFRCWKFRSMFTGADLAQRQLKALDQTDGPHFKAASDPRVTRVGRVLRALNLDEVPQLFNVLVGQMSLVGPRPSPFRENQVCVPWRAARLSVRPGITGFWQVCRHNRAAGDFHQWIEYDLLYVQHQSFLLDLKILAATALTLGGKVRHVPASWLVQSGPVAEEHAGVDHRASHEHLVSRPQPVSTQPVQDAPQAERVA